MEHKPSFIDQLDVDYIAHHGIKGQRWGVRRFQNEEDADYYKKIYSEWRKKHGFTKH